MHKTAICALSHKTSNVSYHSSGLLIVTHTANCLNSPSPHLRGEGGRGAASLRGHPTGAKVCGRWYYPLLPSKGRRGAARAVAKGRRGAASLRGSFPLSGHWPQALPPCPVLGFQNPEKHGLSPSPLSRGEGGQGPDEGLFPLIGPWPQAPPTCPVLGFQNPEKRGLSPSPLLRGEAGRPVSWQSVGLGRSV